MFSLLKIIYPFLVEIIGLIGHERHFSRSLDYTYAQICFITSIKNTRKTVCSFSGIFCFCYRNKGSGGIRDKPPSGIYRN